MIKVVWLAIIVFFVSVVLSTETNVYVPTSSTYEVKKDWTPKVDSLLNAGDTVVFVNSDTVDMNIPYVGLMAGTDGYLCYKTVTGVSDSMYLASGGFHQIFIHKIFPRCAALKIYVKAVSTSVR